MKMDNNTVIVLAGTIVVLAILISIIGGNLSEQVVLVLAGGAVGIGSAIVGNVQRKGTSDIEPVQKEEKEIQNEVESESSETESKTPKTDDFLMEWFYAK